MVAKQKKMPMLLPGPPYCEGLEYLMALARIFSNNYRRDL